MAMEMQIFSPGPQNHWPTVKWNNEELKQEIAKAMSDYQNLVVTPETKQENKALRAKLNKLRTAIETERKSIKARINEPYQIFEAQVKEVLEPVNTAIANLDTQLKEIAEMEKQKKRESIQKSFDALTHPDWLTLDMIWNEKWLNASVTVNAAMDEVVKLIREKRDTAKTLEEMPDFGKEASERYKKTLDFQGSIAQAKESWEIQHKTTPATPQNETQTQETVNETANTSPEQAKTPVEASEQKNTKKYTFKFSVTLTASQAQSLANFCKEQNITLTQIK